jgi:hypothetical protein
MSSQNIFLFDQPTINTKAIKPLSLSGLNLAGEVNKKPPLAKKDYQKDNDDFLNMKFNFTEKLSNRPVLQPKQESQQSNNFTTPKPTNIKQEAKVPVKPAVNVKTRTNAFKTEVKPTDKPRASSKTSNLRSITCSRSQVPMSQTTKRGNKTKRHNVGSLRSQFNAIISEPDTDSDDNKKVKANYTRMSYKELPDVRSSEDGKDVLLKLIISNKRQTSDNVLYSGRNPYIDKDVVVITALNTNLMVNREYTLKVRKVSEIETRILFLLNNIIN